VLENVSADVPPHAGRPSAPTFGVALLNWNGFDDTAAALESLRRAEPKPAHVIVVDNGSQDDSLARLREWATNAAVSWDLQHTESAFDDGPLPWLRIIDANVNRGFAAGNNLALEQFAKRTDTTHFLLLNNDATVAPDYFGRLLDALHRVPNAGLLGSAIYHEPERSKVWYAGGREIPARALVLHRTEMPTEDTPQPTTFVTGCAMLIARSVYERLGGLATCYTPIYWEDTDYSRQAVDAGIPVYWAPGAKVYHKIGSSVGGEKVTPRVAYWQLRHRGYYVRRNYRARDRALALAYLCVTKPGRAFVELIRGEREMASAIVRGFVDGVFGRIP